MRLLRLADPAGSRQRGKRRLKRRMYKNKVMDIAKLATYSYSYYTGSADACSCMHIHRGQITFGMSMAMIS